MDDQKQHLPLLLSGSMRIRTQRQFQHVISSGRRKANARLTVFVAPNDLSHSRLGISTGKRFGNACRRNRVKRLLRESFRLQQHQLPAGIDIVCIPQPIKRSSLEIQDYYQCLARLIHQAFEEL